MGRAGRWTPVLVALGALLLAAAPGGSAAGPPATDAGAEATAGAVRLAPPPLRSVSFAFTGDALWHSPLWSQAVRNAGGSGYDFGPMLARVAPLLSAADVAVCHLETPVAPLGEPLSTYPTYGVPAAVVPALAEAGYDRCSTASNHVFDRGVAGIEATVGAIEFSGMAQSGMARTPEEIRPRVFVVNGIPISHLSYTYWYNGQRPPGGETWRSALIDGERILADAREARAQGAAVVIVSLHWGVEGSNVVLDSQRNLARTLTADGLVDLVVGHGPHVLQPIEQVNGRWVMYSLGNHISNMPTSASWPASTQDGAVATVVVRATATGQYVVERPVVHPTWVDRTAGWVIRPVLADLAAPGVSAWTRDQLAASLVRTMSVVGAYVDTA